MIKSSRIRSRLEKRVKRVSGPVTGSREFYIPHKPVVRESAETTKLRVVYDAPAHAHWRTFVE